MRANRTRARIAVTLSPSMTIALEHLAERHGTAMATEAGILLRQALDRTIGSAEVAGKIADYKARRSAAQWREDVQVEHYVETTHDKATATATAE